MEQLWGLAATFVALVVAMGAAWLGGMVWAEARERERALETVKAAGDDVRGVAAKLAEVHNALALRVNELQEQANRHEFKLFGDSQKRQPFSPLVTGKNS